MSNGFYLLLGVSVVLTIVGIAAGAVHADMLAKNGSKSDIPTQAGTTASTVTILGLIILMCAWPMHPPWYKSKPMDQVYKLSATVIKGTPIPGEKKGESQKLYHYFRLAFISSVYSLIWGIASQQAAKSTAANQGGGGGSSQRGGGGGGGGGKGGFKQPRSPWSNKPY